jgi:predicted RNA-binding protein with PIN domain
LRKNTTVRGGRPLYIVDGYNVILSRKSFTENRNLEEARAYLTNLIDSYASKKMIEAVVVWDGDGSYQSDRRGGSRVKNIFTRTNQSADSRIVSMIEKMSDRKRVIVVSDDRRHITGIAVNLGAKSINVQNFLNLLGVRMPSKKMQKKKYYDHGNEKSMADDLSVNEWLKLFKSRKM